MPDKLYLTRLTFADIQQKDFAEREVAEDGMMEFVGLNVPVMDIRKKEE